MFIRHADSYSGRTIPHLSAENEKMVGTAETGEAEEPVTKPCLPVQESGTAPSAEPTQTSQTRTQEGEEDPRTPLMFAALCDVWRPSGETNVEEPLETVTIVTMDSEGTPVAAVHDRMPMFLTAETAAAWLDPQASFAKIIAPTVAAAHAHAKEHLHMYEVPPLVSHLKNETPDCILPKKEYDAKQFSQGLGKFFAKKAALETTAAKGPEAPPGGMKRPPQCPTDEIAPPFKAARVAGAEGPIELD